MGGALQPAEGGRGGMRRLQPPRRSGTPPGLQELLRHTCCRLMLEALWPLHSRFQGDRCAMESTHAIE